MKLFFGLVSCYWNSSSPGRDVSMAEEAPREEEPMSLLVAPVGRGTQRGRTRDQVSTFRESEWKPSLCTISEEKLVVVVMDREDDENQTVKSEVSVKRRSGSRSSMTHNDDFGAMFLYSKFIGIRMEVTRNEHYSYRSFRRR